MGDLPAEDRESVGAALAFPRSETNTKDDLLPYSPGLSCYSQHSSYSSFGGVDPLISDGDDPATSPEWSGNAPDGPGQPGQPARPPGRSRLWLEMSVMGLVIGLVVVALLRLPISANTTTAGASMMPIGSEAKFAMLSTQHSNFCSLAPETVNGYPDHMQIQGSCCSPMDKAAYESQVAGLRRYESIPEIPQDPYDVAAGQAKKLLSFDTAITLTAPQQETYDSAMTMTHDKGPCCCKCWRWFMTEGLAKFLIVDHSMAAQDVAAIVNLTNGCGGQREAAAAGGSPLVKPLA